jgi:hypothetical protein
MDRLLEVFTELARRWVLGTSTAHHNESGLLPQTPSLKEPSLKEKSATHAASLCTGTAAQRVP